MFFKLFDPVRQQMTRECGEYERANEPFDFCQLALHNTCLNAVASSNTVKSNGLGKSFIHKKNSLLLIMNEKIFQIKKQKRKKKNENIRKTKI